MFAKLKARLFVNVIRPQMDYELGAIKKCPVCGALLQCYQDYGWLHIADGDADCYGALSYGKGQPRA